MDSTKCVTTIPLNEKGEGWYNRRCEGEREKRQQGRKEKRKGVGNLQGEKNTR